MTALGASPAGRVAAVWLAAFAAGVGLGFGVALAVPPWIVLAAAIVIGAAAMVVRRRPRAAIAAVTAAAFLLGGARGFATAGPAGPASVASHLGSGGVAMIATVRSVVSPGDLIVDATHLTTADYDAAASGGVLVRASNLPPVSDGDTVEVDATALRAPSRRPGPESEAALEREDVEAIATSPQASVVRHGGLSPSRVLEALRSRVTGAVDRLLPEPASAMVLGIALGIHETLPADVHAALQDSGLIHIVVVSGLKVVIVFGLVAALSRLFAWSPRRTVLTAVAIVGFYVLLSGSGPAALRSAFMGSTALMVRSGGRRLDPAPMLALAAALMLGLQPRLVLDPGFQLSFLGTAGILLMATPLATRIPGPRLVVEPFAVTVAAQVATAPVMAATFGVVSFVAPLANAFVLPLLPGLIVVGGLASLVAAAIPAVAWLPLHIAGFGADAVVVVAQVTSRLPGAFINVSTWPAGWMFAELTGVAVAVAAFARPRRPPRAHERGRRVVVSSLAGVAAAAASIWLTTRPDGSWRATVLDIGSASAVLISAPDGSTVLVDGGSSPASLAAALGRVLPPFASRVDVVLLTGSERAAVGGLAALPGRDSVGAVIAPREGTSGTTTTLLALQDTGAEVIRVTGAAWSWGGIEWRCLAYRTVATGASACAIEIAGPGGRLLDLGDAGTADQDQLCAMYPLAMTADAVVAPPGGALSPLLLATVHPRIVLVPSAKGATTLAAPVPQTLRTGSDGDVTLTSSAAGLVEAP